MSLAHPALHPNPPAHCISLHVANATFIVQHALPTAPNPAWSPPVFLPTTCPAERSVWHAFSGPASNTGHATNGPSRIALVVWCLCVSRWKYLGHATQSGPTHSILIRCQPLTLRPNQCFFAVAVCNPRAAEVVAALRQRCARLAAPRSRLQLPVCKVCRSGGRGNHVL